MPETPEINIDYHLGYHAQPEDLDEFREHVQNADILIPEVENWDDRILQIYNDIASGKMPQSEMATIILSTILNNGVFQAEMLRQLHKTRVLVAFMACPLNELESSGLLAKCMEISELNSKLRLPFVNKDLENVKMIRIEQLRAADEQNELRESIWLTNLYKHLDALIKDTRFRRKNSIRLLLQMGIAHKGFIAKTDSERIKSSRIVHEADENTEAVYKIIKREGSSEVSSLMHARSIIETAIDSYIHTNNKKQYSAKQISEIAYQCAMAFDEDDIKPLGEFIKRQVESDQIPSLSNIELGKLIVRYLRQL